MSAKTSAKFRSEKALYVVEKWDHGTVLRYAPVSSENVVRISEFKRLVTVANTTSAVFDAYTVATFHAAMLGDPMPQLVEVIES